MAIKPVNRLPQIFGGLVMVCLLVVAGVGAPATTTSAEVAIATAPAPTLPASISRPAATRITRVVLAIAPPPPARTPVPDRITTEGGTMGGVLRNGDPEPDADAGAREGETEAGRDGKGHPASDAARTARRGDRPPRNPGPAPTPVPTAPPVPTPTPNPTPTPTPPPPTFTKNLYTASGVLYQDPDYTACVATSTEMMLNFIAATGTAMTWQVSTSYSTEEQIATWDRANDTIVDTALGTDPHGWRNGLNYYGWGAYTDLSTAVYEDLAYPSYDAAVKAAVMAIARYDKPVGILGWAGSHAQILNGYDVSGEDPATSATSR